MPQVAISGPSTQDEFTLAGSFGPGLHDLRLAVAGTGTIGVAAGSFDGFAFVLGGGSTGGAGTLDLFPNPGPRPAIPIVSSLP